MQYNYDFEIASLVIFAVLLGHFILIRQFPTEQTRAFRRLLVVSACECMVNIISCVGLANAAVVPVLWNEVFVFAFFVLEGLASFLLFRYMEVICAFRGREKRVIKLAGILPFAAFEALVLTTPFTGFFYYFEEGAYCQGFGADWGYLYVCYYFLLNFIMIFLCRKTVAARIKVIVFVYSAAAVFAVLAQYRWRDVLLTSTGNMLILLMLYMAMQNREQLIDSVSGVANEKAFENEMENLLARPQERVLLMIYLRQFGHIGTVLGEESSRQILSMVGAYLLQLCGKYHVFRNSGAAFTVIADSAEDAQRFTEEIKKRFAADWQVSHNDVSVNAAILIQRYPQDFHTLPDYRGMCGYLKERAKSAGNQTVFRTDEALINKYRRRIQVELAVGQAIRRKSFEVWYQPIYSLRQGRIVSLEALVRLKDEKLGFISPDEFIPLAERDGNIIYIGEFVLEEVCRFLAKHVLPNPSLGIMTVHVNVSMAQCLRKNLKESIMPILEKYHIPASMITLEITERIAIEAPKLMQRHMRELGKLGMAFAIDDYGSGNSNCSYLIQFPFREVKIDKDITTAYFESSTARIVLENEIRTIQKLGLPVIVEGIETFDQSEAMERLDVDFIQGYYYGRPMPGAECLKYIRKFHSAPEEYGKED